MGAGIGTGGENNTYKVVTHLSGGFLLGIDGDRYGHPATNPSCPSASWLVSTATR